MNNQKVGNCEMVIWIVTDDADLPWCWLRHSFELQSSVFSNRSASAPRKLQDNRSPIKTAKREIKKKLRIHLHQFRWLRNWETASFSIFIVRPTIDRFLLLLWQMVSESLQLNSNVTQSERYGTTRVEHIIKKLLVQSAFFGPAIEPTRTLFNYLLTLATSSCSSGFFDIAFLISP